MSTFHNNCLCQLCNLCNCNDCTVKTKYNESNDIYEILESFLEEGNDTNFMNISVNDNLDCGEETTKETYNSKEDSIINNSSIISTGDSYVRTNITAVKVNLEATDNKDSEDIVKLKVSKTVYSPTIPEINNKYKSIPIKHGSEKLLGRVLSLPSIDIQPSKTTTKIYKNINKTKKKSSK